MTLAPYEEFERLAKADAAKKYRRLRIPLVVVCAVIGAGGGGVFVGVIGGVVGALAGLMVGTVVHAIVLKASASNEAELNYSNAWCAEHGCTFSQEYTCPDNAPMAHSGVRRESEDAVSGKLNGLDTIFYSFTYWTQQSTGKSTTETPHPFKVMAIQGPVLPVKSLNFAQRGMLNRFHWVDALDSAITSQHDVPLESVDFNEKFKLEMDDAGDEVWIRQVFDPQTIQGLVSGQIAIPNLRYYDQCFWFVEQSNYKARELDAMMAWQTEAAAAIGRLARVRA